MGVRNLIADFLLQNTTLTIAKLKYLTLWIFLLFHSISEGQENLILNPSCEEAIQIPINLAQYDYCADWWKPYIFTTDYFSKLTNPSNNNYIPQNGFGFQNSIAGSYYLGGVLTDWAYSINDFNNFRADYFAGKFKAQLDMNKIYLFEFWMSKADRGIFKTNAIDVVLTYDTIIDVNNYSPYGYKIWSEKEPMSDTVNWVKISTCFKAKGNEKAFAIGNFHELNEVIKVVANDTNASGEIDYRYLDNFSLIECPTCCPEQFPDEEQVYVYSNPSMDGNPASLQLWLHPNTSGELSVYDSRGRLVARKNYIELENSFVFDQFGAGMYHFIFSTSDGIQESGKVVVGY